MSEAENQKRSAEFYQAQKKIIGQSPISSSLFRPSQASPATKASKQSSQGKSQQGEAPKDK